MAAMHLLANPAAVASCLAALADDDSLLLLGEGALALPQILAAGPIAARLGVLADAATTFGVAADSAALLSYADFVAWVAECERSVTWT